MPEAGTVRRFFRAALAQFPALANPCLLLGGNGPPGPLNRWALMGLGGRQTVSLQGQTLQVNGEAIDLASPADLFARLETVRRAARQWPAEKTRYALPMAGGMAGVLAYGFGRWCDAGMPALAGSGTGETAFLFEAEDWLLVDLAGGVLVSLTDSPARRKAYRALWRDVRQAEAETSDDPAPPGPDYLESFAPSLDSSAFEAAVARLQARIAAGDIYQANLSVRFSKPMHLDPLDLYEALTRANPSPFGGLLCREGKAVVSNSPERLLGGDASGRLWMRPIAGTRGRGRTPEEDAAIGQSLLENEKERAEHLMLVDLARNDLGRVCRPGSVRVDELLTLERYSHVTHLVSNVTGRLAPGFNVWEALAAAFPGGTITGCPKLRCMEILSAVEPVPRGFYTGSMGYVDAASGAMDWNILIRSVFLERLGSLGYNAAWHVGAGIVHDSVPAHEYRECLRKGQAVLAALHQAERPVPASATSIGPAAHGA